ncbi:MAG: hypothetical protein QNL83_04000, partial [OM182 bacterium]
QQLSRLKRKLKSQRLSLLPKKTGAENARQLKLMLMQAWCQTESRREQREAPKAERHVQH